MPRRSTGELEKLLSSTDPGSVRTFLEESAEELMSSDRPFAAYMRSIFRQKGISQQEIFLRADLSERFGYRLISGDTHTTRRDYILRICYAAEMTLEETQRALKLYGMAPLYPRISRDAALIIAFSSRKFPTVMEVNEYLSANGFEPLRASGSGTE